jgi:hypothetical protein
MDETDRIQSEEIRAGFLRQRRNVMGAGVGLLLILATGIEFETINILGNSAKIKNPAVIHLALWMIWLYYLIRTANTSKPCRGGASSHTSFL